MMLDTMKELLHGAVSQTPQIVKTIRQLVEIESPSTDPAGVNRLADFLTLQLERQGLRTTRIPVQGAGDILCARLGEGASPVMVLGHLDTVWPMGTVKERPVRIRDGRLYGPGSFDMKGGLALALHALALFRTLNVTPSRPVTLFLTPLEELGGKEYRGVLQDEARRSCCVLVLEPAAPGGAVKTSRSGAGRLSLRVQGQSAHAGLAPEKGVNAIIELAHQLLRIGNLNKVKEGIRVNVGTIRGGVRPNVVPDEAEATIDFRFKRQEDGESLVAAVSELQPVLDGAILKVEGGISAPPMERTEQVLALFQLAVAVARDLGFTLSEASAGGASEGCYTAAAGTPTLDGLGPEGDGAHAENEHVLIDSLPQRTALLAGLLLTL